MKLSTRCLLSLVFTLVSIGPPQGFAAVPSVGGEEKAVKKKTAKKRAGERTARSKAKRFTVILGGVVDDESARVLRKSLRKIKGVGFKAKQLKAGEKPRYFTRLPVRIADLEKTTLGSLAKAVATADLPRQDEVEPTVNLALFATRPITEEAVMALRREMTGVPGVAAQVPGGIGGLIDERVFWVRLDNTGEARLENVLAAAKRAELGLSLAPKKEKKAGKGKKVQRKERKKATKEGVADQGAKRGGKPSAVPEELRGFSGLLRGELVSSDVEKGMLVLRVEEVRKVWKPSTAKRPASAVGRTLEVDGIAGKWLDVLLLMKPGDTIELEAYHKTGRNLSFLGEWLKKVSPEEKKAASAIPAGFRGFRGIFSGKLVSKDVEKGTLVVKLEEVKRTWRQNKAESPESAKGHAFTVKGVSGKWLDVLLVLDVGDRIEIEAFENGAAHLDFVGEWLKKAE